MCMRVLWDISNGKGSLGESSSDLQGTLFALKATLLV
jgi:hypothetical protein